MQQAHELALHGWGRVSPNPMVGAVLVKDGKVIAEGFHAFCGGAHAEASAIAKAGLKVKGADLYVTLEPCSHFGRTPPCTDAIIRAGIKRVFVGALDPNPRMNGRSIKLLQKAGITVAVGLSGPELTRLNEAFNKHITTGRPFVTAKTAQTLDGKIAASSGESKWITSVEAREYARDMRFGFDAIVVGVNTVLKDDPLLTTEGKDLKKVILDTHLRTPAKARLFKDAKPEDVLIFTASKTKKKLNATIVQAPLKGGKIDLKWVMSYLGKQQVSSVLIEGGAQVIGNALTNKIVDKMVIYMAPKILGEGLSSIQGLRIPKLAGAVVLKEISAGNIGGDIYIEGYI